MGDIFFDKYNLNVLHTPCYVFKCKHFSLFGIYENTASSIEILP